MAVMKVEMESENCLWEDRRTMFDDDRECREDASSGSQTFYFAISCYPALAPDMHPLAPTDAVAELESDWGRGFDVHGMAAFGGATR